jgi:hypothetical protein
MAGSLCLANVRPVRILGLPIEPPQAVVNRVLSDLSAIARAARETPAQLERILELGQEIAAIGESVLEIAERLDQRAAAIMELGERIDVRGAEIVERAGQVVETGGELIAVLPALERAIEMATPLEGAIDRFGRLVDRLPGGVRARPNPPTDPSAPPDDH